MSTWQTRIRMSGWRLAVAPWLALAPGCGSDSYYVPAPAVYQQVQPVYQAGPPPSAAPVSATPQPSGSRVLVLQSSHADRPTEVVGIIDIHVGSVSQDAALDLLRDRAAALGADAVLGVEFHHADEGGPLHLSGLAVRFISLGL